MNIVITIVEMRMVNPINTIKFCVISDTFYLSFFIIHGKKLEDTDVHSQC